MLGLKFIPITPAMSAPGRSKIDARVRTFMISFVRCSVRAISTSNEPMTASFASRAAARAVSVLAASSLNLFADSSVDTGSNSEEAERHEDLAVRRERAAQPANPPTNLDQCADLPLGVASRAAKDTDIELLKLCFDRVERPQITRHHPLHEYSEEGWCIEDADFAFSFGAVPKILDHREFSVP